MTNEKAYNFLWFINLIFQDEDVSTIRIQYIPSTEEHSSKYIPRQNITDNVDKEEPELTNNEFVPFQIKSKDGKEIEVIVTEKSIGTQRPETPPCPIPLQLVQLCRPHTAPPVTSQV